MKKINILGVGAALVDRQFYIEDNLLEELKLRKGSMDLKDQETQNQIYKKLFHPVSYTHLTLPTIYSV